MPVPFKLVITTAVIAIATSVMAVDIPDSGRLLRESSPPPSLRPQPQPPKIEPRQQQKEAAPVGVRVKVVGFTFTGNTIFSNMELSALMSGYIGTELTLAELNGAAATITNAYRARGYFLATANIPPQTIEADAPIVIVIVEGFSKVFGWRQNRLKYEHPTLCCSAILSGFQPVNRLKRGP